MAHGAFASRYHYFVQTSRYSSDATAIDPLGIKRGKSLAA